MHFLRCTLYALIFTLYADSSLLNFVLLFPHLGVASVHSIVVDQNQLLLSPKENLSELTCCLAEQLSHLSLYTIW
ncbi:hypothetical protein PAHAL_3G230000 [Panicum hallii]|uniref:Uncharacterized protein n=1 Tax=Panicum hallii TaxID=206008 RepID=A0A2T8KJ75_9POAL|nr:hypothetical protein PAHAL_3G230000 [Panicum hallii]